MSDHARRDVGRFTIVPEWIVRRGFSPRALLLYVELGFHADYQTGRCYPSHARLAAAMGCSVDTVQRAQRELEDGHAILVERRTNAAGERTSNLYTVLSVDPIGDRDVQVDLAAEMRLGSRSGAGRGSRTSAAGTTLQLNEEGTAAAQRMIAERQQEHATMIDLGEPSPRSREHARAIRARLHGEKRDEGVTNG